MVSIDEAVHKRAQDKGYNISRMCENALMENAVIEESHVPQYTCTECGKVTDEGFICLEHKKLFCRECELKWDTAKKCTHDIRDGMLNWVHFHRHVGLIPDCLGKTLRDIEVGNHQHLIK